MRLNTTLTLLVSLFLLGTAGWAEASRPIHAFDCNACHKAGMSTATIWGKNVCLQCHQDEHEDIPFMDGNSYPPKGEFSVEDASDAMGEATKALTPEDSENPISPSQQTSHYWASPKDVVPAAGARAPSVALYRSRYGTSTGRVTCTRCHDPHKLKDGFNLEASTNKLLRMKDPDAMCLDCHRDWNMAGNRGLLTHPLVKDYPAFVAAEANKFKYKSVDGYNSATLVLPSNEGAGQVRMVYNSVDATGAGSGPMNVSCTSCHGVHFTDSDSSTADGMEQIQTLNPGDGKLLLSDGPRRTDIDPKKQGELRSNLCQACHVYQQHGDVTGNDRGMFAGCLDCHSGHVYDGTNTPNYFVLRKNVSDVFIPKLDKVDSALGLLFTTVTADWANASNTGYCQGCHTLDFPHNGIASGPHGKASCVNCHFHNNKNGSFVADCSACHGFPPINDDPGNITPGGYAIEEGKYRSYKFPNTRDQNSLRDIYKLESQTPHKRHAAGGSDYGFGCDNCHSQAFSGATPTHLDGIFQSVDFGAISPYGSYNPAGDGTCTSVYCHSSGNAASSASRAMRLSAETPSTGVDEEVAAPSRSSVR